MRTTSCARLAVLLGGFAFGCGDDATATPDAGGVLPGTDAGQSTACESAPTTFAAIERSIFAAHGCTADACHGRADGEGGLDLRPGFAFDSLVNHPSTAALATPMMRVLPGEQEESFLYLKLAALTYGDPLPTGGGTPMPNGPVAAVPPEKLEALRLWIRSGASEDAVVMGTDALLGCELPPATPLKAEPLEPPAAAEGFQLYAPPWDLPEESENEVCYATYYDLSAVAPEGARTPCPESLGGATETCVMFHDTSFVQDAQSHHSIIDVYFGPAAATDASWGGFTCLGGEHAGMTCDPTRVGVPVAEGGADCGPRAGCASAVQRSAACIGVGPADLRSSSLTIGGSQDSRYDVSPPDGVYGVLPIRGFVMWNSHGFNLTTQPTNIEQYLNMYYAAPADQMYMLRRIFEDGQIFAMNVPAFGEQEICATWTVPEGGHVTLLSSHVHQRGRLFRIWDPPNMPCSPGDSACVARADAPIYSSTVYNDATVLTYDPARAFDAPSDVDRTLLYCATFDNGANDPSRVKRQSTSPRPPGFVPFGGPCPDTALRCIGGDAQGEICGGDANLCTGGGECDACPLTGGLTTEDEMFILFGFYYQVE
jgi:hypothetical protein